jgi:acylphosphatase
MFSPVDPLLSIDREPHGAACLFPSVNTSHNGADLYGVTGWVRNEPNGSVSMEVQGTEEQIDQVIIAIERGSYIRIEQMDVKTIPVIEHDRDFRTVG